MDKTPWFDQSGGNVWAFTNRIGYRSDQPDPAEHSNCEPSGEVEGRSLVEAIASPDRRQNFPLVVHDIHSLRPSK